jgi:hypothetical protein
MPYGPPPDVSRSSRVSRKEAKEARAQQAGASQARDKHVQVTLDLSPEEFDVLNRWLAGASVELHQPVSSMTFSRGIKAMIQATAADQVVSDVVLGVLRDEPPG